MLIDIIKQTPREYSAQSRDYQVIARLYTALFNISKMYIDDMEIWNSNIDNKLTNLRSKTLNFHIKHSWDEDDLEAVTSCFKFLMRNKGATKALEYCINILMKIENVKGELIDQPVTINNYTVTIKIPESLLTIGIVEDLVEYLLPAGLTYNIIRYKSSTLNGVIPPSELLIDNGDIVTLDYPYSSDMYIGPSNKVVIDENDNTETIDVKEITNTFVYTGDEFNDED